MKHNIMRPVSKIFIVLIALLLLIPALKTQPAKAVISYEYYFQDHFNQNNNLSLYPLWSWVREDDTHWSLESNYDYMTITTQSGGIFENFMNDQKNLLLTHIPNTPFLIETKVTINPTQNYQHAALLAYQDDDNYVEVNFGYVNDGLYVGLDNEKGGTVTQFKKSVTATTLCLALQKFDESELDALYYGIYQENCAGDWTSINLVGSSAQLTNVKVGIGAGNSLASAAEIPAKFDYLQIWGNFPIHPFTFITDHFTNATLDSRWTWFHESPTHWSLTNLAGTMRIDTAGTDLENVLVLPAPLTNFMAATSIDFKPDEQWEFGYIILYRDDNNFMKFGRYYDGIQSFNLAYDKVVNGNPEYNFHINTWPVDSYAYLMILKEGQSYFSFYSDKGMSPYYFLTGRHEWTGDSRLNWIGISTNQDNNHDYDSHAHFDYFNLYYDHGIKLPLIQR